MPVPGILGRDTWSEADGLTKRWWLLVGAFVFATALLVAGFVLGNAGLTAFGVVIGVALYLGRRYFQ